MTPWRLVATLASLLVCLFGHLPPIAAAVEPALPTAAHSYTCESIPIVDGYACFERGPPSATYTYTPYGTVDRWSHGASARSVGATRATTTTYDTYPEPVQVAQVTPTTQVLALLGDGDTRLVSDAMVAANTSTRLAQDIAVSPIAPPALGLGRSIGRASHNQALQAEIAGLPRGATGIRVNQQQVNAAGQRVGINRPDLQYTLNGQRYYVEYEGLANPRGALHEARILANDPGASFILRIVP